MKPFNERPMITISTNLKQQFVSVDDTEALTTSIHQQKLESWKECR